MSEEEKTKFVPEEKADEKQTPDFQAMKDKISSQPEPEEKPKRTRTRRKKKQPEPEIQAQKSDLTPMFLTLNMILGSAGYTPLTQNEIDGGVEAWFPVYQKYLPYLIGWSIWIPPIMWTAGTYMSRKEEFNKKAIESQIAKEEKEEMKK